VRELAVSETVQQSIKKYHATVFFEAREQFRSEAVVRIRISHCRGLDQPSGSPEQHALKEVEEQLQALGVRRR
jgi:hypothetical protein